MNLAPVSFISHGAPTFAIEPGVLGPQLQRLGAELTGVEAVLVVSPHWQSRGLEVMSTLAPETIHDFGGFPPALYALQYPAPGSPDFARETARLLSAAGYEVKLNAQRGFDHGAWVPLRYLLPRADLPVFQVSMPLDLDTSGARKLGETLAPLRDRRVMIVGSGTLTHNLPEAMRSGGRVASYVGEFAAWVREAVLRRDTDALTDYRAHAPAAARAHPTDDHYLPLLIASGAARAADSVHVIDGGVTYGLLSMDSYIWGMRTAGAAPSPIQ